MEDKAIKILDANEIMAIATVRPDGWPQNTTVCYANEGTLIYFLISRSSQKFANLRKDQRVGIAIGSKPVKADDLKALSLAAIVSEVTDRHQRERAVELLFARHPNLKQLGEPDFDRAAMMRAQPSVITILDYSRGFGHADELTLGASNIPDMQPGREDNWGFKPATPSPEETSLVD